MDKRLTAALVAVVAVAGAWAAVRAEAPALETDEQKKLYAVGVAMSRQIGNFGLTEADLAYIQAGLADGVLGREPKIDLQTYGPQIEAYLEGRMSAVAEKTKAEGKAYRDKAAAEEGATTTEEGMVYLDLKPGTGPAPANTDTVKVHYTGMFIDGRVFDSSREGGEPATFPLNGVVPCFSQGIQRMKVGGTARLVCPPELAYGDRGAPPMVPPGATLVFEVELLEIVPASAPPQPAP